MVLFLHSIWQIVLQDIWVQLILDVYQILYIDLSLDDKNEQQRVLNF